MKIKLRDGKRCRYYPILVSKLELFEKEAQHKQSKRMRLSHYFDDNADTEDYTQYYDYDFIDQEEEEISDEDMLNADILDEQT